MLVEEEAYRPHLARLERAFGADLAANVPWMAFPGAGIKLGRSRMQSPGHNGLRENGDKPVPGFRLANAAQTLSRQSASAQLRTFEGGSNVGKMTQPFATKQIEDHSFRALRRAAAWPIQRSTKPCCSELERRVLEMRR